MANLPSTAADFFGPTRIQLARAERLHEAWRVSLSHADRRDGASRTLAAIDDTIRELTACREALAAHIEAH